MAKMSTKTIGRIEERMEGVPQDSVRYRILESAKNFKTSWVDLGQSLYSVWKDRLYKDWGYMTFDAYTSKEIGIKKATALKLVKSYYFLEKEEPAYLRAGSAADQSPANLPTYESVNVLRLAKNRGAIDGSDYVKLKHGVLEMGRDARDVKKDLTVLMKQREELEPEEARRKRKEAVIKRLLSALKALKTDIETSKILPSGMIKDVANLIHKIELEMG
jgi:hypothetical protein